MKEHYLYDIPVFVMDDLVTPEINIGEMCQEIKYTVPRGLLEDIEAIYFGEFPELENKNAIYADGAIYITNQEPTLFDILENFYHELAHSLEERYGAFIFDKPLEDEFLGKRHRLKSLLDNEEYRMPAQYFKNIKYSKAFDKYLADVVGYPKLVNLTMGLFVSPYGATSLQEYFANGFENYLLGDAKLVKDVSPVLYSKIESIVNDNRD